MSGSSSFFVEEMGMGESSEWPDLVDSDSEGDVKEETQEEFARVEREINLLKKEKAVALLRGYLKKWVTEIQKKLSEKETRLGVLNEVQGLLRDVGEKEESQGSEKGDVSLDGLDLSGRFQHQLSPVKPPAYGDDHWKWHVSGGPVLGANETREFIIRSLGATRKGGVEAGTTQEWHLLQGATRRVELRRVIELALMTFL